MPEQDPDPTPDQTDDEDARLYDRGDEPTASTDAVADDAQSEDDPADQDPDTFPKEYVLKLRDENAKYRQRAAQTDEVSQRLHTALVAATGRLADPTDLAYDQAHLDDPDALTAAVDDLLRAKPHLASRRPVGDVGQGASLNTDNVDLAGILRSRAG